MKPMLVGVSLHAVIACAGLAWAGAGPAAEAGKAARAKPAAPAATAPAVAEAYSVVVVRDGAMLRCGAGSSFYQVAMLKAGTILSVDGEESGFLRAAYPAGTHAFVQPDDVSGEPKAGESAKLQRGSRLRAAHASAGYRMSWYPLLEKDLAPGTEVRVLEVVKGDEGKTAMYAIAAPAEARGWVSKDMVRRATAADMPKAAAPAPTTTAPTATTPTAGGAGGGTTTSAAPAAGNTATPGGATPPGFTTVPMPGTSGGTTTPTPANPADGTGAATGQPTTGAVPQPTVVTPAPVPVAPKPDPVKDLVAMYERVRTQPLNEAELEPAIAAFEAQIRAAGSDSRTAKYLQRHVEVMKIRLQLRNDLKAQEKANADLASRQVSIEKQLADLDKNAIYKAIGRLMPSTVYDGIKLPKLYRLVSPEPMTARTIGYLSPDPSLDLDGKLNRVVGVIGESRLDESLKAMLLTPSRVDLLSITPTEMSLPDKSPASAGDKNK